MRRNALESSTSGRVKPLPTLPVPRPLAVLLCGFVVVGGRLLSGWGGRGAGKPAGQAPSDVAHVTTPESRRQALSGCQPRPGPPPALPSGR